MKRTPPFTPETPTYHTPPDTSSEIRSFAAWMGLVIIAFGVATSGYLFWKIGGVLLDPRAFETQVDRWEFVVRGRTTDAFPDTYETPDRRQITNPDTAAETAPARRDRVEEMAEFAGRMGSKSARPAALLLIILVLSIMVRISIAIINAGIRLAYLTAGEKDYMKRIVDELVERRNNHQ